MKSIFFLALAATAATAHSLVNRAPKAVPIAGGSCAANNCARAVTGTAVLPNKPDPTARRSDCSSFLLTTVYYNFGGKPISTNVPTAVPTYASACTTGSPQSAYASACSCWGVAPAATVVPVPDPCVYLSISDCPSGTGSKGCACFPDNSGSLSCLANYSDNTVCPGGLDSECASGAFCIQGYCHVKYDISYCAPHATP